MLCPKDNVVCEPVKLSDVEVNVCSKCQGVCLNQEAVKKLSLHFSMPNYSDVSALIDAWEVAEKSETAPKDFWSEDTIVCTHDGVVMKKHYFAGSKIGVDQCHVCKRF